MSYISIPISSPVSHGVGTDPREGTLKQVPSPLLAEILTFLPPQDQATAASSLESVDLRVTPHLPLRLRAKLIEASSNGDLYKVKYWISKLQQCKANADFKIRCIQRSAEAAKGNLHPVVQNYLLDQLPKPSLLGKVLNICSVALLTICTCGIPCCFRACDCENIEGDD